MATGRREGAAAADVVCVLGMGRSGTSVTARLLDLLGVYLGRTEELLPPAPGYNPTGFWEHQGLTDLDDEILAVLGGSWNHLPAFDYGWVDDPRLASLRARAAALLETRFAGHERWGWKDPRTSVLLPFWQALLPRMRYVVCVREPADVAASLVEPFSMTPEHSHEVWFGYTASALVHTSGAPRIVVAYEDTIADPIRQLERLARFLGPEAAARAGGAADAARVFVDSGLQHHRASAIDPTVPLDVRALHALLVAVAATEVPGPLDPVLDHLAEAALDARARLAA